MGASTEEKRTDMSAAATRFLTSGEKLRDYLDSRHFADLVSMKRIVSESLMQTGRGGEWADFIAHVAVHQLLKRLVCGAVAIVDGIEPLIAERSTIQFVADTMRHTDIRWGPRRVFERLEPCVRAATSEIGQATRKRLVKEAARLSPYCYLCGVDIDFSGNATSEANPTLDHVWPRALGGESVEENLLVACERCNNKKGESTWGLASVQAFTLGFLLPSTHHAFSRREIKIAQRSLFAHRISAEKCISLKDAYLSLGRPTALCPINHDDAFDFFNLTFDAAAGI